LFFVFCGVTDQVQSSKFKVQSSKYKAQSTKLKVQKPQIPDLILSSLFPFTYSSDHKPGSEDHGEEDEYRNQHDERIPHFS
jgi:hypothetical protein